jgi:hypothetical protein
MDRRHFLKTSAALSGAVLMPGPRAQLFAAAQPSMTRWQVVGSEGLDAVAFTGALAGGSLYLKSYSTEAAEFGSRLPAPVREDLARLDKDAAAAGFGLLWPGLASILSGTDVTTIDSIIAALSDPEARIRPALQASPYWDEKNWSWFATAAPELRTVFAAMRNAGFATYRKALIGSSLDVRIAELRDGLSDYDLIKWQRKLSGKRLDPTITIVLLYFSKPHGVRVQGQRFLEATDYNVTTTLRIAAHELLHPPFDMDGAIAKRAIGLLQEDPVIARIVREHDPRWGYRTIDGYLNEDICQALDQIISEVLGFARNPADRWNDADDGMHVLAAALYGLLRSDRWQESGGSIEQWLGQTIAEGRLAPAVLHHAAAQVLDRPADRLWPLITGQHHR